MIISLQKGDREILVKFKKFLNSKRKISIHKRPKHGYRGGESCYFYVYSKQIVKSLKKIGFDHNKTKTAKLDISKIPDKYFNSFMLGFTDGDGTVYLGRTKCRPNGHIAVWQLIIHNNLYPDIIKRINRIYGKVHICITKHPRTPYISALSVNGRRQATKYLRWLYKNSPTRLNRKYKKYKKIETVSKKYVS